MPQKTLGKREPEPSGKLQDPQVIDQECTDIDEALAELKARYEQYFLGIERKQPIQERENLRKRILRIKSAFIRNTGLKFRVSSLHNKYLSYERLWLRTSQQIEEGTYKRDLFRAKLHQKEREQASSKKEAKPAEATSRKGASDDDDFDIDEAFGSIAAVAPARPAAAAAKAAPAARPGAPALAQTATTAARPGAAPNPATRSAATPSAPRPGAPAGAAAARPAAPLAPRPTAGSGGLSEDKIRTIYDAYVNAKKRCNENTSGLSLESVSASLKKQVPALLKQTGAKSVDFKVVIKDGKAVLKAVPK